MFHEKPTKSTNTKKEKKTAAVALKLQQLFAFFACRWRVQNVYLWRTTTATTSLQVEWVGRYRIQSNNLLRSCSWLNVNEVVCDWVSSSMLCFPFFILCVLTIWTFNQNNVFNWKVKNHQVPFQPLWLSLDGKRQIFLCFFPSTFPGWKWSVDIIVCLENWRLERQASY